MDGMMMGITTGFEFGDWGSWGLYDFYPDHEKLLKETIESGKPFDSGWHGWKKAMYMMRIFRMEGAMTIYVSDEMDDLPGLIYDCLHEDEEEKMKEEMVQEIEDSLNAVDTFASVAEANDTVPGDISYGQMLAIANDLIEKCRKSLNEAWHTCITTTMSVLHRGAPNLEYIIKSRIEEIGE